MNLACSSTSHGYSVRLGRCFLLFVVFLELVHTSFLVRPQISVYNPASVGATCLK